MHCLQGHEYSGNRIPGSTSVKETDVSSQLAGSVGRSRKCFAPELHDLGAVVRVEGVVRLQEAEFDAILLGLDARLKLRTVARNEGRGLVDDRRKLGRRLND